MSNRSYFYTMFYIIRMVDLPPPMSQSTTGTNGNIVGGHYEYNTLSEIIQYLTSHRTLASPTQQTSADCGEWHLHVDLWILWISTFVTIKSIVLWLLNQCIIASFRASGLCFKRSQVTNIYFQSDFIHLHKFLSRCILSCRLVRLVQIT